MNNPNYPKGWAEGLIESDKVRPATKQVLQQRLKLQVRPEPKLLSDESFARLAAICFCFFPSLAEHRFNLAAMVEETLVHGKGKGWRYRQLPPLQKAIVKGLDAIEAEAMQQFQQSFTALAKDEQDALLHSVQKGTTKATAWNDLPADLFFTELLVFCTEQYYSHPAAKSEIGEVAFADAQGWTRLGLNNLEPHEPLPINHTAHGE